MSALWLGSLVVFLAPNGLGLGGNLKRADDAPPPPAPVTCLSMAPDAPHAFSGRADGHVWLHDVDQGTERELGQLPGAIEGVACAAGGVVVAIDDQGHLLRLNLTGDDATPVGRHEPGAMDVAVSPDGKLAASAGTDGTIWIWDLTERESVGRLEGHEGPVAALAWGPERLWSAGWDHTVRSWKISSSGKGKARGAWPAGHRELTAIAADPHHDRAISASWTGLIRIWAAKGRKAEQQLRPTRSFQEAITSVAYDRSGERAVAVAAAEKQLRVFATGDATRPAQILTELAEPSAAVFIPGQDALLVGFYDGRVVRLALPAAAGAE